MAGSACPRRTELKAAIPPSLLEMGQGKKLRIMFQGGGNSAPAGGDEGLFLMENVGLEIEIDVIPPESLREKQLSVFTAGSSEYDLMELYPTWIGEYAEAGFIDNLDPMYEKYGARSMLMTSFPVLRSASTSTRVRGTPSPTTATSTSSTTARTCGKMPRNRKPSRPNTATIWLLS